MWASIIGIIIGILIGGSAVWVWLKYQAGGPEEVAALKRENARFREEVNEHFIQTAELINQLTDSYKAVFDHLSEGAEKLVQPEVVRERMPQVTDEEVRLKRLGAPRPVSASKAGAAESEPSEPEIQEPEQKEPEQLDPSRDPENPENEGPDQPR